MHEYRSLHCSATQRAGEVLFPVANAKQKDEYTLAVDYIERALWRWEVVNAVRILFPLASGVMFLAPRVL